MADQDIAASLSAVSFKSPLPNFPLPRELRDQIYGHLLDSDYTRIKRTFDQQRYDHDFKHNKTGPKAYHFHTNIIAVNRVIHDEAEELLYKRNIFIVASYQWPGLHKDYGGCLKWVKPVCEKHVARMQHHSLRLHFTACKEGLSYYNHEFGKKAPVESCMFLAQDLEAFCSAMHAPVHWSDGLVVSLNRAITSESEIATTGSKGLRSQLKCDLRNTKYRHMDHALQYRLLGPLSRLIGPSQRVTFTGSISDYQHIEILKRTISPSLICLNAGRWALYECLCVAKGVADAAAEHDDLSVVTRLYESTIQSLRCTVCSREMLEWARTHPEDRQTIAAYDTLYVEVLLNLACALLKMGDWDGFLAKAYKPMVAYIFMKGWFAGDAVWPLPDPLKSNFATVGTWRSLYGGPEAKARLGGMSVGDMIEQMVAKECGPYQLHDLKVLKQCSDPKTKLSKDTLPLELCGATQVPFVGTSYYKTAESAAPPSEFDGYLDLTYLRTLDDSVKKDINERQKKAGLEITRFDRL